MIDTPTSPIALVRYFNAWRVGGDMDQPEPSTITRMLTDLCDYAERLERELAAKDAHADEIYKAAVDLANMLSDKLDAERALTDRLAGCIERMPWIYGIGEKEESEQALSAWKEARKA